MKLLSGLWRVVRGAAVALLPVLAQSALQKYRKKNPKHGWLIDAIGSEVERTCHEHLDMSHAEIVDRVTNRVVQAFPGADYEAARTIAKLHVSDVQAKKP